MRKFTIATALALALAACGPKPSASTAPVAPAVSSRPAVKPMSEGERELRAEAGAYYFDFEKDPRFVRFTPAGLDLSTVQAKRFEQAMDVASPSRIVAADGIEALVFTGCVAHDCGDTAGVLAIELSTGDVFAGVKDEKGTTVLKPSPALQKLLEDGSPTHDWANPAHG